ncbi:hypothetical protein [Alteribacter keqinensis]|uniref:Uncharacterized protein n=1 Tax=Alteribacter keqinensis TaxID=2483800 RepID=A0A3M7TMY1_9BACI|nr:hypothetical protein [Alteribacter keqinensis]RNA66993.1 hypothetical protein EBO34_17520 [Alteribacter keqinensis]
MNKNFLVSGYVLFLSGLVLFGLMHVAIALYVPHLGGWGDPPGKFVTVLNEIMGWVPYVLSVILMIVGAGILLDQMNKWIEQKENQQ